MKVKRGKRTNVIENDYVRKIKEGIDRKNASGFGENKTEYILSCLYLKHYNTGDALHDNMIKDTLLLNLEVFSIKEKIELLKTFYEEKTFKEDKRSINELIAVLRVILNFKKDLDKSFNGFCFDKTKFNITLLRMFDKKIECKTFDLWNKLLYNYRLQTSNRTNTINEQLEVYSIERPDLM